jgi:hypothetical protein
VEVLHAASASGRPTSAERRTFSASISRLHPCPDRGGQGSLPGWFGQRPLLPNGRRPDCRLLSDRRASGRRSQADTPLARARLRYCALLLRAAAGSFARPGETYSSVIGTLRWGSLGLLGGAPGSLVGSGALLQKGRWIKQGFGAFHRFRAPRDRATASETSL